MNVVLIGLTLLLMHTTPVTITTYGIDDEFFGQRHAASWHGVTPIDAPEVVDAKYFGCASNDFPLGTRLEVTRTHECNGDILSPTTVQVVVIDRLATGVSGYVDLWPAPAAVVDLGQNDCALGVVEIN